MQRKTLDRCTWQRIALLAGVLLLALAAAAVAKTPLPGSPNDRSVHDLADVVSPADESTMERTHTALVAATGVAIVLVTVPALEDETISDFALRVGETWGAGGKEEERGIVIAFSLADRRIFVATGYGVEGYLPDGKVGRLIDTYAMPYLRTNDFSKGLRELSTALVAASADEFNVSIPQLPALDSPPPPGERRRLGPRDVILGIVAAAIFLYLAIRHPGLLLFLLLSSGGRGRGGGGFGSGGGFGGFGGGGFGGGGAGRGF